MSFSVKGTGANRAETQHDFLTKLADVPAENLPGSQRDTLIYVAGLLAGAVMVSEADSNITSIEASGHIWPTGQNSLSVKVNC